MKIIPGAIVGKISGSLGGMTAAHGRGGYYLRNRVVPVNPNSAAQQEARNAFTYLTSAWRDLTAGERQAWEVAAANSPTTDRLGESLVLTGSQAYVACNQPRLRAGLPVIDAAPLTLWMPAPLVTAMAITDNLPGYLATITIDAPGVDVDVIMQVSRPLPDTIQGFKGPWRLLGTDSVLAAGTSATITGEGFAPIAAGQRIAWRLRYSGDDGRLSPPVTGFAIVPPGP